MNYKKNLKYLKGTDTLYYLGLGIAILGGVLFLMGEMLWIFFIPYQYYVAIALATIGGLLVFIPSAGRASAEEIDSQIKNQTDELVSYTEDLIPKSKTRQPESPMLFGDFNLEGDGVLVRRSKDGKYRSSSYTAATVFYKKESLHVCTESFSIVSDDRQRLSYEISYADQPEAVVEDKEVYLSDKKLTVKTKELQISDNAGTDIHIPVQNSVVIDEFCEKLALTVKKSVSR